MFNGLINLVLFLIFAILDYYLFDIYHYSDYFNNFNSTGLLVILGLVITEPFFKQMLIGAFNPIFTIMSTQLGLYTTLFFIDRNDSPCHIFIVFVFGQFGYYFYNFEINAKTSIVIICLVLIFFFSLVFNEIIELKFCKIAHNTKKNITQRAENEVGNA